MFWLILSLSFPSYFTAEQTEIAKVILEQAKPVGEDAHLLVSIAWVETRLNPKSISKTNDYGLFQINWTFWGRRWGYKDRKTFYRDMSNPYHATVAAMIVLKEMRKYKSCQGLNLPACYNGGPGWLRSKNKAKILAYANKVNRLRIYYKKRFPNWGK